MSYEKSWFEERIGKTVIRTNTYDNSETEFEVTAKNTGYLWLYTEKGYTFRDVATKTENVATDWLEAAKPNLRIHRKPFAECEACSA